MIRLWLCGLFMFVLSKKKKKQTTAIRNPRIPRTGRRDRDEPSSGSDLTHSHSKILVDVPPII